MAQIFRIENAPLPAIPQDNALPSDSAGNLNAVPPSAHPQTRGAVRIGLAGFRNDPTGLLVMVDVGGLEPGNYPVGVSEPGLVAAPADPTSAAPANNVTPAAATPNPTPVPNVNPSQGVAPPAVAPGDGAQPQSGLQRRPRSRVLAQVVDADPEGGAPSATPAVEDPTLETPIPPTSQVNEPGAAPAGSPPVNTALRVPSNQGSGANGSTLNEIGVLTVDESGTGRIQQVVEGVSVRDVVGQAIVIYSQSAPIQNTLPPNLDPTVDAAADQAVNDPNQTSPVPNATAPQQIPVDTALPATDQTGTAQPVAAPAQQPGSRIPVAAGVIRLISDRRPGTTGNEQPATESPVDATIDQPVGFPSESAQDSLR
jgi:hypothetical protein